MEILVIGDEVNLNECKTKFGDGHSYDFAANYSEAIDRLNENKIVFDFILSKHSDKISTFQKGNSRCVFVDSNQTTLSKIVGTKNDTTFFGFCGLPTFLNREILELTIINEESKSPLDKIAGDLSLNFKIVEDRVGMVTPRIICMIINEAYFTIEENVASRTDIDLAMKLGTNYPFGPFEWCQKIGVKNVYQLLKSVFETTNDERYKISSLLEKEASA
ncbi:MAG: 3-hydroxyacyl-CoA dehydrogenase family protein [Cyclobacteriaceae bacterium]